MARKGKKKRKRERRNLYISAGAGLLGTLVGGPVVGALAGGATGAALGRGRGRLTAAGAGVGGAAVGTAGIGLFGKFFGGGPSALEGAPSGAGGGPGLASPSSSGAATEPGTKGEPGFFSKGGFADRSLGEILGVLGGGRRAVSNGREIPQALVPTTFAPPAFPATAEAGIVPKMGPLLLIVGGVLVVSLLMGRRK